MCSCGKRVPLESCCTAGQAQPLNGLVLVFEETPMLFIQLQFRAFIPCPTLKACQTQAKLVSCGGAQCSALCKVHSTLQSAPHILQMSGTQHRNKMVFPDGSHPRDLMCLHLNYCSRDNSFRAVCSYQVNY